MNNIKLQLRNKLEKPKLFFTEGSLKALNIFRQSFECRQQTVEIKKLGTLEII